MDLSPVEYSDDLKSNRDRISNVYVQIYSDSSFISISASSLMQINETSYKV